MRNQTLPNYDEITTVNFEQANGWEIYPVRFATFDRLVKFCERMPEVPDGALRSYLSQISKSARQTKNMWSYGFKHEVERYSDKVLKKPVYCSNTGFIVAAVQMGFKAYPVTDYERYSSAGSPNWHFNFKWSDVVELQNEIRRAQFQDQIRRTMEAR